MLYRQPTFAQEPLHVASTDQWDRRVPDDIRRWYEDGQVRAVALTELVKRSTLKFSAAVHAACGARATLHHLYFLVQQQRALEAAQSQSDGSPRRAGLVEVKVPEGWTPRVELDLGCGTNTSSTRQCTVAKAAIHMPITPGETFCYEMPPGACARSLVCVCASARAHTRASEAVARACRCACVRLRACARAQVCL